VLRWEVIIHHHLKRDKVIPSSHPQFNEVRFNPSGCKALVLLVSPCHPAFTNNGILIQPHHQQGKRTLDDHFCRCEFYYYCQRCYLNTKHNWTDDIHIICFLGSCQHSNILRTLCDQEKHVPDCRYKFTRERIVTMLKEYLTSLSFLLLGGRPAVHPTVTNGGTGSTSLTAQPSTSAACYRFG